MNPNIRQSNETQAEYRLRLRQLHKAERSRLRLLWNSTLLGTYIRTKHGELTAPIPPQEIPGQIVDFK